MTSTFIGRALFDDDALFVTLNSKAEQGIYCPTLENLLHLVCIAVTSGEEISFNEVPYIANPSITYLPLTKEQFKELEIMYEKKIDMKTYKNPFVREK